MHKGFAHKKFIIIIIASAPTTKYDMIDKTIKQKYRYIVFVPFSYYIFSFTTG